ncbi:MAG: hypothetical protein M1438_10935 [Deltaproteobacteria bacterium]|nr:hypothetical protein [Deltaproteobacteria bacterium]
MKEALLDKFSARILCTLKNGWFGNKAIPKRKDLSTLLKLDYGEYGIVKIIMV